MTVQSEGEKTLSIVESKGYLEPAMDVAAAKKWRDSYEGLKAALLRENDYFEISGPDGKKHRYIRRSGLQLLCNAFGIKEEIIDKQREEIQGGFISRVKVRAYHENSGHFSESWGVCSSKETRFSKSQKVDHDVEATAETRAKKRAQANMIGTGEVMMDEDDARDYHQDRTQPVLSASTNPVNCGCSHPTKQHFVDGNVVYCYECAKAKNDAKCNVTAAQVKLSK